jgi:hypothetical protein
MATGNYTAHLQPLIHELEHELRQDYAPPHIKRHAHPKMHGCVQATLRVDAQVPLEFRHGVFATPGHEFRAWVRFSNALGIEHDLKFGNRGFAIKLLDVRGAALQHPDVTLIPEAGTQDFVMSTGDAFVLPDTIQYDYKTFATAARKGIASLLAQFRKPRTKKQLRNGLRALIRGAIVVARNPIANWYYSQTPYRLGPLTVKLHARPRLSDDAARMLPGPVRWWLRMLLANVILGLAEFGLVQWVLAFLGAVGQAPSLADNFCDQYLAPRNYLRLALTAFLRSRPAQFDIMVQKQTDAQTMPVNDATVSWDQKASPFEKVATLTIPQQVFWPATGMPEHVLARTIEMMELGENMSFMPWHGIVDHEPLGDINRARGVIYTTMSTFRHAVNHVPVPAPAANYAAIASVVQPYAAGSSAPVDRSVQHLRKRRWP